MTPKNFIALTIFLPKSITKRTQTCVLNLSAPKINYKEMHNSKIVQHSDGCKVQSSNRDPGPWTLYWGYIQDGTGFTKNEKIKIFNSSTQQQLHNLP